MKMMKREHYKLRYEDLRTAKRVKEEEKRWERFLIDRAEFDENVEKTFDTYEFMMRNERY
jgi:hypothetical protein